MQVGFESTPAVRVHAEVLVVMPSVVAVAHVAFEEVEVDLPGCCVVEERDVVAEKAHAGAAAAEEEDDNLEVEACSESAWS
jgi:hypothetical protein